MKLALLAVVSPAAIALSGCTEDSPLSRSMVDVWVYADPAASPPTVQVSLDVIDHLDSFADAVSAGEIHVTLDDRPLVLDPRTGFTQQGGSYSAILDLGANTARAAPGAGTWPMLSQILVTDGSVTWHAQFVGLFTNDLAPVAPLAAGDNTFEWPSSQRTNDGVPEIESACLEVVGRSSHCTSYGDGNPNGISQQYVTLASDATPNDTVVVTATRWDDAQDSGASQFIAQIKNRYITTQR
jgi:hypothetical protein